MEVTGVVSWRARSVRGLSSEAPAECGHVRVRKSVVIRSEWQVHQWDDGKGDVLC